MNPTTCACPADPLTRAEAMEMELLTARMAAHRARIASIMENVKVARQQQEKEREKQQASGLGLGGEALPADTQQQHAHATMTMHVEAGLGGGEHVPRAVGGGPVQAADPAAAAAATAAARQVTHLPHPPPHPPTVTDAAERAAAPQYSLRHEAAGAGLQPPTASHSLGMSHAQHSPYHVAREQEAQSQLRFFDLESRAEPAELEAGGAVDGPPSQPRGRESASRRHGSGLRPDATSPTHHRNAMPAASSTGSVSPGHYNARSLSPSNHSMRTGGGEAVVPWYPPGGAVAAAAHTARHAASPASSMHGGPAGSVRGTPARMRSAAASDAGGGDDMAESAAGGAAAGGGGGGGSRYRSPYLTQTLAYLPAVVAGGNGRPAAGPSPSRPRPRLQQQPVSGHFDENDPEGVLWVPAHVITAAGGGQEWSAGGAASPVPARGGGGGSGGWAQQREHEPLFMPSGIGPGLKSPPRP